MIKLNKIVIGFSECSGVRDGSTFNFFSEVERYLRSFGKPSMGYWKTDVEIFWEDGESYKLRYDIGADCFTLKQHIEQFISHIPRIAQGFPSQKEKIMKEFEQYKEFIKNRQLEDYEKVS